MSRLLIVEGEATIAKDIHDMTAEWGWHVIGLEGDATSGLRRARLKRPDVAIVGLRLPGELSGIDVGEALRREMRVPVIYLTGPKDECYSAMARVRQPFALIDKPFDAAYLRRVLDRAFRGPGSMSASCSPFD